MMPSQNAGMPSPVVVKTRIRLSLQLPLLRAASVARGTAISSASRTLPDTRNTVGSIRVLISLSTSILYSSDLPISPCTVFFMKYTYCVHRGSSRPYWARMLAVACGVEREPSSMRAGSPGIERTRMKVTKVDAEQHRQQLQRTLENKTITTQIHQTPRCCDRKFSRTGKYAAAPST